jgi:solute:Na+ symporter, SSS family
MHWIDWLIMIGSILLIAVYGMWRTRNIQSASSYLQGDKDLKWWTIGLSVMATQASAITFLSTPGQAYESGMGFAQFYFGLPVAMVILCIFFLPLYYRLNVYTAYEFLENRFDVRTRTFTALLFLIQRGLAAGITIYAPAIILSQILGWSLHLMILLTGLVVILYTYSGGTKAVSVTQKQQMVIILSGMVLAAVVMVNQLPENVQLGDALTIAGKMGKLEVVDFNFDLSNRYNFWSGMLGGVFLFLSYFGTDQSQVQRYLSGKSLTESRLGLLFNGIVKVPMQFLILFVGVLVFVFFLFVKPPLHFNASNIKKVSETSLVHEWQLLEERHSNLFEQRKIAVNEMISGLDQADEQLVTERQQQLLVITKREQELREEARGLIKSADPKAQTLDTDYVFITFIMQYLPIGMIGLLLSVIFSAAMSSTSSELSALATTTVIDIYQRFFVKNGDDAHYLKAAKWFTLLWGGIALAFAASASLFENLIQAVNIIGSLFYGVILGIFMVAFFLPRVGGRAVLQAAVVVEVFILLLFAVSSTEFPLPVVGVVKIAYLWLNLIGCVLVMALSWLLQAGRGRVAAV